jgi:putative spermidine/putrescine transport system ATP-binding protein
LREEIRNLQRELGITTLFVTHDQEEALSIADRVAVLRGGQLEQCAAPNDLYDRPSSAFVAEFVGTMNRIPGRSSASGDAVEVLGQRLPVMGPAPAGVAVDVLVRPESVTVQADPDSAALVVGSMFFGSATRLTVRLADDVEVKADLPSHTAATLPAGTPVRVTLADRPVLVDETTR